MAIPPLALVIPEPDIVPPVHVVRPVTVSVPGPVNVPPLCAKLERGAVPLRVVVLPVRPNAPVPVTFRPSSRTTLPSRLKVPASAVIENVPPRLPPTKLRDPV